MNYQMDYQMKRLKITCAKLLHVLLLFLVTQCKPISPSTMNLVAVVFDFVYQLVFLLQRHFARRLKKNT